MTRVKEDIIPKNAKGQAYGLWEEHFSSTGHLYYKCTYNNGELVGYKEYYFSDKFNKSYYL